MLRNMLNVIVSLRSNHGFPLELFQLVMVKLPLYSKYQKLCINLINNGIFFSLDHHMFCYVKYLLLRPTAVTKVYCKSDIIYL